MTDLLVQFRMLMPSQKTPSIEEVCRYFEISDDWLDQDFGVIATDPDDGLYTILVSAEAATKLEAILGQDDDPATGVFSNVKNEAFDH